MDAIREHFHEGGWGMFPTLLFGSLMLLVAVAYARSPEKRFVPLLIGLGISTLTAGALGFVTGVIATFKYIEQVAPKEGTVALLGIGESLNNVAMALAFVVFSALAASYGALKIARGTHAPPVRA